MSSPSPCCVTKHCQPSAGQHTPGWCYTHDWLCVTARPRIASAAALNSITQRKFWAAQGKPFTYFQDLRKVLHGGGRLEASAPSSHGHERSAPHDGPLMGTVQSVPKLHYPPGGPHTAALPPPAAAAAHKPRQTKSHKINKPEQPPPLPPRRPLAAQPISRPTHAPATASTTYLC